MSTASEQSWGAEKAGPAPTPQLRNSCDTCNVTKVKCSQTRPSCTRCGSRGLYCVYSVSLRSAKQPATTARKPRKSKTNKDNEDIVTHVDHAMSNAGNLALLPLSMPFSAAPMALSYQAAASPSFPESGFDPTLIDGWNTDFLDTTGLTPFSAMEECQDDPMVDLSRMDRKSHSHMPGDQAPHTFPLEQCSPVTCEQANHAAPTMSQLSSAFQLQGSGACSCQQSILSKLSELALSSQSSSVPVDQSLSDNRTIIALCTSTLNCRVRRHSDDLVLMLTLIALISRTISVYDGLFHSSSPSSGGPNSSGPNNSGSNSSGHNSASSSSLSSGSLCNGASRDHHPSSSGYGTPAPSTSSRDALPLPLPHDLPSFAPVRLSLGSYQLDHRDEQILQMNLLKIELGKIEALVDVFRSRFVKPDAQPWDVGGQHETKAVEELLAYMHSKLRSYHESLRAWGSAL